MIIKLSEGDFIGPQAQAMLEEHKQSAGLLTVNIAGG